MIDHKPNRTELVFKHIRAAGSYGITRDELVLKTKLSRQTVHACVQGLMQGHRIEYAGLRRTSRCGQSVKILVVSQSEWALSDKDTPIVILGKPCKNCNNIERNRSGGCISCTRARSKAWNRANPKRRRLQRQEARKKNPNAEKLRRRVWNRANPDKRRKAKLLQRYGLSYEEYDSMLKGQNNRCKICSIELKNPQVDHCHITGKVRGILCASCNSALGSLKDSPTLLTKAIQYLLASGKTIDD